MNKILKSTACIFLIAVVAFTSCKKEKPSSSINPPPLPPPRGKTIKARVVEIGTNLPIAGATLTVCTTPLALTATNQNQCAGNYVTLTTNSNGECFFEADEYRYDGVLKDGFWGHTAPLCNNTYFGDDTSAFYSSQGIHTADSFIIKVTPITLITIHIKNSIASLETIVGFYRSALWGGYNGCGYWPGGPVFLRPNIDTTIFNYPVFGNADNLFLVSGDEWAPFSSGGAFYNDKVFISNSSNIILEITY
jgi:hypothetical protein